VLNPERPEAVWLLLHRRNYAGLTDALFSRAAALEAMRRLDAVHRLLPQYSQGAPVPADADPQRLFGPLRELCQDRELDFLMIRESLPLPHLLSEAAAPFGHYYLYACADLRVPGPR